MSANNSLLPAVPQSRATAIYGGVPTRQRTGRLRRVALEYSLNTRWQATAVMASQDASLKGYHCPIVFPTGYGDALLGSTSYTLKDLDFNGQWTYCRLHYLVRTVVASLADADASHPLGSVRVTLGKYQDLLLWNAAADLILAQKIVDAENYGLVRNLMSSSIKPIAIDGVAELRGRVLYIIDALDLIYRRILQCERFRRTQAQVIITSELEDALCWFQAFMEVAESMRESEEEPLPTSVWHRFRRRSG